MKLKSDFYTEFFTTYDLGLAAALIATAYRLDHVDKTKPHKVLFVFRRENDIEQVVERFWGCQWTVDAQTYFNAIKLLKNRIYSN